MARRRDAADRLQARRLRGEDVPDHARTPRFSLGRGRDPSRLRTAEPGREHADHISRPESVQVERDHDRGREAHPGDHRQLAQDRDKNRTGQEGRGRSGSEGRRGENQGRRRGELALELRPDLGSRGQGGRICQFERRQGVDHGKPERDISDDRWHVRLREEDGALG